LPAGRKRASDEAAEERILFNDNRQQVCTRITTAGVASGDNDAPGPPGSVQLTSILKTPLAETGVLAEQNSVNCACAVDTPIAIKASTNRLVISFLISLSPSGPLINSRTMRVT
jgi:hypothetical protein